MLLFSNIHKNICKLKKIKVHKGENTGSSKIHLLRGHPFNSMTFRFLVLCIHKHICAEKAMAPHSTTLAWKTPWTEEPGRLQSMGSLRVRHD